MNTRARHLGAIALFSWTLLLCTQAAAQQPSAAPAPGGAVKIHVNVNAVLIPVVVRDAQGLAVGTLKREDFQIFDKDKPQTLSGFTIEKRAAMKGDSPAPEIASAVPGVPPSAVRPQTAVAAQRFVVFLFDDLHLAPGNLAQVQKAAIRILPGSLSDSDVAAVVSFTGTNSGLTRDHAKLQEAVMKIQSRNLNQHTQRECPDLDYYRADLIQNKHDNTALEAAVQDTLACAQMDPRIYRSVAEGMARSAASRALTAGDSDVYAALSFVKELLGRMSTLPGTANVDPSVPRISYHYGRGDERKIANYRFCGAMRRDH